MRELWFGIVCVSVYIQNMCPELVVLGTISFISFDHLTPLLCFKIWHFQELNKDG